MRRFVSSLLAGAGVFLAAGQASAYSPAQIQRGEAKYQSHCLICHGADLTTSRGAAPLRGPEFTFGWKGRTALELFEYLKLTMPPGAVGSLTDQDHADLMAVILRANGETLGGADIPVSGKALAPIILFDK